MPVIGEGNLEKDEIFRLCLEEVPSHLISTKQPKRVKETALFLVDQISAEVKHPSDFDACESLSSSSKSTNIRWYEVKRGEDGLSVSTVVQPVKTNGLVVSGERKVRVRHITKSVSPLGLYAIIRRRCDDRRMKETGVVFVRTITFVMSRNVT